MHTNHIPTHTHFWDIKELIQNDLKEINLKDELNRIIQFLKKREKN